MRHPADSKAWKELDRQFPKFASDPRNVRLGLASDGFNPFGNMSTSYSVWPVVLIPYNLPPWMCMKDSFFMLSLLIPGPKAPGNDIDVYMRPLIDDLKGLWDEGTETYDALSKTTFQLRAAVLWTINDFPALANLSGWSTKGTFACPACNLDTRSVWLPNGHKTCYMGHRRFLPVNHPWRNNMKAFDGKKEKGQAPKFLTGVEILKQYRLFNQIKFGKSVKKGKKGNKLLGNWKKKSIFFDLPYWSKLLIRHNLDVMHIEKNLTDSIIGTLLSISGKTKDNLSSRFDLEVLNIRHELHASPMAKGKYKYESARYTLSPDERRKFCEFLTDLKVPDGYSSNVSRYVNSKEGKISGMKCHDCHVFLHRYLPLAIRGVLDKEVCEALIELSGYFRELCAKSLSEEVLERLEKSIVITLCKLEKIFPPSFFDIMVHLPIHLATETKIAGPVQFRWMYPIERFLRRLKSYVKNKARPEGSIAEAYLVHECVAFCSRYLDDVETMWNRTGRHGDQEECSRTSEIDVFAQVGKALGGEKFEELTLVEWGQTRSYVLKNCDHVSEYIKIHKEELKEANSTNVEGRHEKEFIDWFKKHVLHLYGIGDGSISDDLFSLACGPDRRVYRYSRFFINGWLFDTRARDMNLSTQNSGVLVRGDESTGFVDYFGILTDIVKLDYIGENSVVLFKCEWFDVYSKGKGTKEDRYGFVLINSNCRLPTNEPYILATQAELVYYVRDTKESHWYVVVKTKPRDVYDLPVDQIGDEPCQENEDIVVWHPQLREGFDEDNLTLTRSGLSISEEGEPVKLDESHVNLEDEELTDYEPYSSGDEQDGDSDDDNSDLEFI